MVKGCHSNMAMAGILMKTQSPGECLKLLGFLMTKPVTFEGRTIPSLISDCPKIVK